MKHKIFSILLVSASVAACGESISDTVERNRSEQIATTEIDFSRRSAEGESQATARWYSATQVSLGKEVFAQNCAECHGPRAGGIVEDWRQRLDDGSFPPPPLDGSAHAWHHPTSMLLQVINNGGQAYGGNMPPFVDVLDYEEKLAAIAYFQNFWTDEIYLRWERMGGTN